MATDPVFQQHGHAEFCLGGLTLKVVLKKGQLETIDAPLPIQVGPRPDPQQGLAAGGTALVPEVQDAP
jgi:hypothetical protein